MALEAPKLDNRTFDQIYNEALLKIPLFTPEWTDFNDSDPGITLLQQFASLTEMMLYQMNQVPERNYIKFLDLIGMTLKSAKPARAHLTFVANAKAEKPVVVPQFTQVEASSESSDLPVIFETEKGLSLITRPLLDMQIFDGGGFQVVTQANALPDNNYFPFGWDPQVGNALYFGFEPLQVEDAPVPGPKGLFPERMSWRVFKSVSQLAGQAQSCLDTNSPPIPTVKLIWEYRPSDKSRYWHRLDTFEDESIAFTREGYIQIAGPDEIAATLEGRITEPRYWIRCRLAEGAFTTNDNLEIDFILPNTVEAVNLSTVQQEVLGISNGLPNQTFTFQNQSIASESLWMDVEIEDQLPQRWQQVPDFLASKSDELHFTLDPVRGEITFGNGDNGRIPVAGSTIVAISYRFGGGDAGNVNVDAISNLVNPPRQVEAVTNKRDADGGQDAQSIEALKKEAPKQLRSKSRAVTDQDYESLALKAGGIARAKAIPLAHPEHLGVDVPGAITVVIVPDIQEMPPVPSANLIRSVCQYLNQFRLITSEVFVKGPTYKKVKVVATVQVDAVRSFDAVKQNVVFAINELLHPLGHKLNPDPEDTRPRVWEFGQDLYPSGFYSTILGVSGVRAANKLKVFVNDALVEEEALIINDDGLLYGDARHEITIVPFIDQRQQG